MRRAKRILMVAMVAPFLFTLFAYGAILQPIRFGPPDASRMCYEDDPIQVRIQLYDGYLPIPFAQVKLYDDGVLIASANTGLGGECSPIHGIKPGSYLMIATGAGQMFVDYIDVYDVAGGIWKKQYFAGDDSFERVINYGLFPGKLEIDGFVTEVPPLTAVHITRQSEHRFEEGWLSLRPLLEPFRDIIWNPLYAMRVLPQYMIASAFLAVIGPAFLSKRRRTFMALALMLMFLTEFGLIPVHAVTVRLLNVDTSACSTCTLHQFDDRPSPPDFLVIDTEGGDDEYRKTRIVFRFSDLAGPFGNYYTAKVHIDAWAIAGTGTVGVSITLYAIRGTTSSSIFSTLILDDDLPYSNSFDITIPTDVDYYQLRIVHCPHPMTIDFLITFPPATNETAISLVTKYSFKTGFGRDNPIDYKGPKLPHGVMQAITETEMLVESMLVRQYSVHLLPDWAVRGEIANALVGWVHMQPTNIFGMSVPDQRWEEPPSGIAISPNEVVFTGKIRSGYNPDFNQRIPFPFAPYYEFPTIFEIPLDHGRLGGSTVSGLENATFLLQMDIGLDDTVVLSPPWFEEGDIVSYVYPISLALGSIPFIPKLRQLFAQLKHVPDEIGRVFRQVTGRSPPPAEEAALREAVEEGFQRAMREEVLSTRLHIENAPRMPTRQELANMDEETRILYDRLAWEVAKRQDYEQILARLAKMTPILRDREFVDEILEKVGEYARTYEGTPTSISRRAAEYLNYYFLRRAIIHYDLHSRTMNMVRKIIDDLKQNPENADEIYAAGRLALDAVIDSMKSALNKLSSDLGVLFHTYVETLANDVRTILAGLRYGIGRSSTNPALALRNIEPKVWYEEITYTSLDLAGLGLGLAVPVAGAAATIAWIVFYTVSLGTSVVHAFIIDRGEWDDPTGLVMAGAFAFKVRTPSGVRLAYISAAPNIGFGLFGGQYRASDIVHAALSTVSEGLGYGPPVRIREIIANNPAEAATALSSIPWSDLDNLIASAIGLPPSQIKLIGIAFMPVYIPYTNAAAYRFGKEYVFDFSDAIRAIRNTGVTVDFVAILPSMEITDPNTMLNILHPVVINGIEIPKDSWSIRETIVGTERVSRPYLSYPLDVRTVGQQPSLRIETRSAVPFSSVIRMNVTQEFLWDPTESLGGFGVPCVGEEKYFRGYFQVLSIRFYRYPVLGTEPPDKVEFHLRTENATVEKVYGSDLMTFTGTAFTVSGTAFRWVKVGEDPDLGITYWDGELRIGVNLPVFRFILGCGYGVDIRLGDRDATRGIISGSVRLDGSTMEGYTTIPTLAIFSVNAYRPPAQPNEPRITARTAVGYYIQEAHGPSWVELRETSRTITSFPSTFTEEIGDLVTKALELANRTRRPVVLRAMMTLEGAPPGYAVVQPSPAEWIAHPREIPHDVLPLGVRVYDGNVTDFNNLIPIGGATVYVENKTHTFTGTTDEFGYVEFNLTTDVVYTVWATASGYLPSEKVQVYHDPFNPSNRTEVILYLFRAPSENASVTVYVYDAETSNPIEGASVSLDSFSGTTGADGIAVFNDVPFGSYVLEVTKAGYTPYRRTVSIANSTVTIRVPLLPERDIVTATVTVLNALTGLPVVGAVVQFENGTMVYTGVTDSNGIATITLPFGGYTLRVSASGYYPFSQTVFVPRTGFSTVVRLSPVDTPTEPPQPPTPPEECNIELTTIKVTDSTTGAGIAGASVTLVRGGFTYRGTTDSNGEAKFCITSGIYNFRAEKAGYQTVEGSSFIAKGSLFVITMTPLSEIPSGRLNVLVVDASNNSPIAGASVTVKNSTHILTGLTGSDGRTSFILTAGGYVLTVRKSGYLDYIAELEFRGEDTNYTVSMTPHGMCEYPGNWTEPVPCGYRWLVIDVRYKDGFPASGVDVIVSNSTTTMRGVTDSTGKAKFVLSPGTYTVNVTTYLANGTRFTTVFTVNLDQNLWLMVFLPEYSPHFTPEVYPLQVSFVGPRRGIWNEEHLIAFSLFSNVPQDVTARVMAINYTALIKDNVLQVLASKVVTVRFSESAINTTVVSLTIPGSGFALVAPAIEIISFENDTDTANNRLIGVPIPFGPLVDISIRLIVEVESSPTGALVPELTRMRITLEFWSTHDLPIPARIPFRLSFISAETGREVVRTVEFDGLPRIEVQNVSFTYTLEWTNVTRIDVSLLHDLEVNEVDNNSTAIIRLDRAVKLVSVKAPPSVRSGSLFNVSVTVLSNWWPVWTYFYTAVVGDAIAAGDVFAPYGYSNVSITARAPIVQGTAPVPMKLNVTVYPDFAPHDNSQEVTVNVIPEGLAAAVPLILLVLGLLVLGVGGLAAARASRRAHAVALRRRRTLRYWDYDYHALEQERRRRRVLR